LQRPASAGIALAACGRVRHTSSLRPRPFLFLFAALFGLVASPAHAAESLCDSSFQDCRSPLINLIRAEQVGIDVGFWFMEDSRYVSEIIARKNAGVPVRLIVDPTANPTYPLNANSLNSFANAGVPMVKKVGGGIMHFKMMLFAGQNIVEFGSANYSPNAFVPVTPYSNYVSETIFFEDDPAIVNSFKTKVDNIWTDTTNYQVYANVTTRTRAYPTYPISADMNFPPGQDYANRAVKLYNAETQKIDVMMFRVTDRRHSDAMIAAENRGIPIRYIGETNEYRDPSRLWVAWNMDRMFAAGIPMRVRGNQGENHEKLILLYAQGLSIFGSSNWTSPSANYQQEHNYFTNKNWMFVWFENQFERKWNNTSPAGVTETEPFVPLGPDKPKNVSVANGAVGVATTGQKLKWYGGPWAHVYDVYFGTSSNPPLFAASQALGPSETTSQNQSFTLPTLIGGTTYYWKIVSTTAANLTKTGDIWSFTTAGSPPPPPPPPPGATTIVLWASKTPSADRHGNWTPITDASASGGSALSNPNLGAAKISPALASPTNYFEQTFTVLHGTAYHLWVRLRAGSNSLSNDSVHVQFSGSVDSLGSPQWRIGSTSSAEIVLQAGTSDASVSGWGWSDDGWDAPGKPIYFAADGAQTVRIQQREDGAIVDEIVLSPDTYLTASPGVRDNDTEVLPANDGSGSPPPPPPPPPAPDVVLWTADVPAQAITGNWQPLTDATAAGGVALSNPDGGQAKISPALASPSNFFEMTFDATAGVAYHLWVRMRAQNNSLANDSIHLQFNDAVASDGTAMMRIGTTDSAAVVLQDGSNGAADHGWGWSDNGWDAPGVNIAFATTGTHTIRVQQREDGAIVDQIVLSPGTYLTTAPGARRDDTTIISP
jgi:phosphatidylserine/phosphatidylglycerophosphate/cardiolipin synthase-like enzyme